MYNYNQSLKSLKVKQLDIVLLHLDNNTAKNVLEKGEALQTLQDLKNKKIIHYIGVTLNGDAVPLALQKKIDVIEFEYNLLNQTNAPYIDVAYSKNIAVIIRGGLGTGLLTSDVLQHLDDKDLPYRDQIKALLQLTNNDTDKLTALSLAFLYANPHISSVIIGADRPEYITKDIKLLRSFKDKKSLLQAIQTIKSFKPSSVYTEMMGEYYQ